MTVEAWGRTRARRWRLLVVTCGVAGLVVACGGEEPSEPTTPGETPTTGEPTPSPTTSEPAEPMAVPAYYVVDTRAGLRLAREWHEVTDDPVAGAVAAMIAGATDPDYATTWDPGTEVLGIDVDDDVVTVDLSEEARTANVGSEGAALMVQQLVCTVAGAMDAAGDDDGAPAEGADDGTTSADGDDTSDDGDGSDVRVMLTVEGEPAGELWGTLMWDAPVAPADPLDVRVLVQIDQPAEGAEVDSPVTVSGDAAAFEANVPWRVLDPEGNETAAGFTMTTEGQTFAPYSFTLDLDPGTYTVEISEDDPSGGAGGTPMTDTRTITVR